MRRLPLAAAVAALLLTASACGSDDTSAPVAAPTSTTSEPASPTPSETASAPATPEPTTAEPTTIAPSDVPTTVEPSPAEPTTAEPTEAPSGSALPETYADAVARFDAKGQEPVRRARFVTADDTYCLLDSDFVIGCELAQGAAIPTSGVCNDAPSQKVGRIEVDRGGPEAVCNTDTIREPGARRQPLDSVAESRTGLMCLVESIGVTCIDRAKEQGFFLGSGTYALF